MQKNCSDSDIQENNVMETDNGVTVGKMCKGKEACIDNCIVVSHSPYLINKFKCLINVEVCSAVKSVKYIYKYILVLRDMM